MRVIRIHREETEYRVVRTTRGGGVQESITCRSPEELGAVLLMLGVAYADGMKMIRRLEWSSDVETAV